MAMRTPPSWLQNGSHPAENDRLSMQTIFKTTGIVNSTDMAVTQNGTPNMSVNVAAGWSAILGTYQSNMGVYVAYNDATYNVAITTASALNPRIDLIVATVRDAYYTGASNDVILQAIAGTPAGSPAAPSAPANSIILAQVLVGTSVTSIVNANITDTRVLITSPFGTPATNAQVIGLIEKENIVAAALTGTVNIDCVTSTVWYYTVNASANFTLNFRGNSTTTLNALLAIGQSITVVVKNTNGATPYYASAIQIDTVSITPKWQGGSTPSAGNASSIDAYSYTITKTASATYTVLASQTKFA